MQRLYVASVNGQRVRAAQSLSAPILKLLPFNSAIDLADETDESALAVGDGGWHWRKLANEPGWIAEHRVQGQVKTVNVIDRLLEFKPL